MVPSATVFLTSLIHSLSFSGLASAEAIDEPREVGDAGFPEPAKRLLLTLHSLFPHCVLDALDIIDRRLVTRIVLDEDEEAKVTNSITLNSDQRTEQRSQHHSSGQAQSENADQDVAHRAKNTTKTTIEVKDHELATAISENPNDERSRTRNVKRKRTVGYYVSSASSYSGSARYRRYSGSTHSDADVVSMGGRADDYHVHLTSWNCSCPAFAFALCSGSAASSRARDLSSARGPGDTSNVGEQSREGSRENTLPYTHGLTAGETQHEAQSRHADDYEEVARLWKKAYESNSSATREAEETCEEKNSLFRFGGISLPVSKLPKASRSDGTGTEKREESSTPPLCKHLLACVLVEFCPHLFSSAAAARQLILEKTASVDDVAAWAGGYGI